MYKVYGKLVRLSKLTMGKTLAYYATGLITTVTKFMVHALGGEP
jgi:hypothetical protein